LIFRLNLVAQQECLIFAGTPESFSGCYRDELFMSLESIKKNKIIVSIGIVIAILILVVSLLILFSESIVKHLVEGQGNKLGREIAIDGSLNIDWHWTYTAVHAEDIRVANAEGYAEPQMLTIKALDLTFKPLQLMRGRLEFGDIVIDQPHLSLERKSEQEANWIFTDTAPLADEEPIDNRHEFPIINTLQMKNGALAYRDAVKGLDLDLELNWVIGEGGDEETGKNQTEEGFKISGTGSIQEQPFELEAAGDSLEALRDSTHDFPLYLKLVMGPTEIVVNGTFKDPIKLTGVDASLEVKGANMADLFYLTSIPLPPTPPYSLTGQLTKSGNTWGYEGFAGKVDGSDLAGDLFYQTGGERAMIRGTFLSELLDSDDLGGFIGLPVEGENATLEQEQAVAEKEASPNLIPDVPLEVKRLRAADLDITLKAKKIEAPNLPFKGMDVHFDLRDGLLKLNIVSIALAEGTIDGVIEVDAQQDIPPMKMDLNFRLLRLGQFFAGTRFEETSEGFFGGKISLNGTGASLANVLSSSDGQLTLVMADGKISLLLIEAMDLDIGEALPIFLGNDKSTEIRCAVVDFSIAQGLLTSDVLVLDTDDSRIVGNMKINMKDEAINAELNAHPKDNSVFSIQTPILINGSLKNPSIGIDAKKAGTRTLGAVALGALLTPLASILAFADVGDSEDANCSALIDIAAE
jgi:uncharacterized protein involved in outer membrane biogenesis